MTEAFERLRAALPAIGQIVLGLAITYLIARYALGHETPLLAIVLVISTLGLTGNARPVQTIETGSAMVAGVVLSELLVYVLGRGFWQLVLIAGITLVMAVLVTRRTYVVIPATIQSVLVVLVQGPDPNDLISRPLDGIVGAAVAFVLTLVLPRSPIGAERRAMNGVITLHTMSLTDLNSSLRRGDADTAEQALERLRDSQWRVNRWNETLMSAEAIARLSPIYRKHRAGLAAHRTAYDALDIATRSLRAFARRVSVLTRNGRGYPDLAQILADLVFAVGVLGRSLEDASHEQLARQSLVLAAQRLNTGGMPEVVGLNTSDLNEMSVRILLRPLVVDYLRASGLSKDEAIGLLPRLSDGAEPS